MKIQTQLTIIADELKLSENILTINGTDYDLSAPQELSESESPENQRVYLRGEETVIFLKIDTEKSFMFTKTKIKGTNEYGSNLMRFYDVNDDGDISLSELAIIVEHWNMSEEDRREAHKVIRDEFLKTGSVEDWLMKGVKKDPA